jgi:hypothetical protein
VIVGDIFMFARLDIARVDGKPGVVFSLGFHRSIFP